MSRSPRHCWAAVARRKLPLCVLLTVLLAVLMAPMVDAQTPGGSQPTPPPPTGPPPSGPPTTAPPATAPGGTGPTTLATTAPPPTSPQGEVPGTGPDRAQRREAAQYLMVELVILHDWEAFGLRDDELPPSVSYVWEQSAEFEFSDKELQLTFDYSEELGAQVASLLRANAVPLSSETEQVLDVLSTDDYSVTFETTFGSEAISISIDSYETALIDLLKRPADVDVFVEIDDLWDEFDDDDFVAEALAYYAQESESEVEDTTAPTSDPALSIPPISEPVLVINTPSPPNDDKQALLFVLGGLAVVLVVAVVVVATVRKRPAYDPPMAAAPAVGPLGATHTHETVVDLLDVSRQLSAANDAAEVQELAVRRGIDFAHGDAGAFIVRGSDGLLPGYQTEDQLLIGSRLDDGVIKRVIDTGQTISQVSQTEPAIANLPVALVAVPVIAGGQVIGVLMVLRNPSRPFMAEEVDHLDSLAPVIASSFETAKKLGSMEEMALVDGLTSLGNRRRLDRELPDALMIAAQQEQTLAVVMVDVDHFKNFNDTQGHAAGDEVLRRVGRVLSHSIRPGDTAYRYGGEEFAIVLPNTDEATAVGVANRVRLAIAKEAMPGEETQPGGKVTVSLGVAAIPGATGDALFVAADNALYRAKEAGRNRVVAASDNS